MEISNKDVLRLREQIGVGIMDCKKALQQAEGNFDKAVAILREQGLKIAAKKADRIAAEGAVETYVHMGGKIGVMVEINCETDFVANTKEFKALCHDIALHIAAAAPLYLDQQDVPEAELLREKELMRKKAENENKPEAVRERMAESGAKKYMQEVCLMEQFFIKDTTKTIRQLITELTAKCGEKVAIRRFVRFVLGEGIEKKQDDLSKEVEKLAIAAKKKS